MPTRGVLRCDQRTPCVVAVFGCAGGDLLAAVADCAAVEAALTPAWLRSFAADVATCRVLVLDCNASAATLDAAAQLAAPRLRLALAP
jgi:hypothetical protein